MADLIERTEELILAVNAGARAIENTKRYHGTTYCIDVFADKPKEIPYLKAAQILRGVDALPAVDAVEVVRCKDCVHCGFCGEATNLEVMGFYGYCSRGKRREENG